jgi:hypothetical protein
MKNNRRLTQKQENFCRNIFSGMSQREAFFKAGYSNNYSPKAADVRACQLFNTDKIQIRMAEINKVAEDATVATVLERKQVLTKIIRTTAADYLDENGDISFTKDTLKSPGLGEVKVTRGAGKDGLSPWESRTIKIRNPVEATSELNRMEKIYDTGFNIHEDNRQINILVQDKEAKELIGKLLSGHPREIKNYNDNSD